VLYQRLFDGELQLKTAHRLHCTIRAQIGVDHLTESGTLFRVDVIGEPLDALKLNEPEGNKAILDWLQTACQSAARFHGWPLEAFDHAYQSVISRDFRNEWIHKKSATRKDRAFRAELHCKLDAKSFRSDLVILNRLGQPIYRSEDLLLPSDRMIFGWELGGIRWKSEKSVELLDTYHKVRRVIDIPIHLQ
jgi:hypothetical protein